MSHIMQPGTTTMTFGRSTQTDLLGQFGEGVSRHTVGDPTTALGDEERRSCVSRKDAVPDLSIFFQRLYGGVMKGQIA